MDLNQACLTELLDYLGIEYSVDFPHDGGVTVTIPEQTITQD